MPFAAAAKSLAVLTPPEPTCVSLTTTLLLAYPAVLPACSVLQPPE